MDDNKRLSDAEHKVIRSEVEKIAFKMHEGFRNIDESIKANFKNLQIKSDAESEVRGRQLEEILKEAKETNGRVTVLENLTEVFKILSKRKNMWLLAGFLLGVYFISQLVTIDNIRNIIKFFL